MKKTNWFRKCYTCDNLIYYKTEEGLLSAIKRNKNGKCHSCKQRGRKAWNKGMTYEQMYGDGADSIKKKVAHCGERNGMFGKKHTRSTRTKMKHSWVERKEKGFEPWNKGLTKEDHPSIMQASKRQIGDNNVAKREDVKNKLSISGKNRKIKEIEERNGNQIIPNYNQKACKIIDEYGEQLGYNFQHAENGSEYKIPGLPYWVDGYDEEKNVVIEYYEKHHEKQQVYDDKRKKQIIEKLNCRFIEIWE